MRNFDRPFELQFSMHISFFVLYLAYAVCFVPFSDIFVAEMANKFLARLNLVDSFENSHRNDTQKFKLRSSESENF